MLSCRAKIVKFADIFFDMDKNIINTSGAPAPIGPYSQAVVVNNILYISGQICLDPESGTLKNGSIQEETAQVMKNLGAILKEAGTDFDHVIKSTIFITDMHQFAEINEVYAKSFTDKFPARETVQVSALPKFVNVEISMMAIVP